MQSRKYYIFVTTFVILCLFWILRPERTKIDGLSGEFWNLIFTTDTKYSDGYAHSAFNSIRVGMIEKEVLHILGQPLTRWRPYQYTKYFYKAHYVGLQYCESPNDTHYRLRQVYLDNGIVKERFAYFYID